MHGQAFASFRRRYRDTRLEDFRLRPLLIAPQTHNAAYLRTKVERMGHEIPAGPAANATDDGVENDTHDALAP